MTVFLLVKYDSLKNYIHFQQNLIPYYTMIGMRSFVTSFIKMTGLLIISVCKKYARSKKISKVNKICKQKGKTVVLVVNPFQDKTKEKTEL